MSPATSTHSALRKFYLVPALLAVSFAVPAGAQEAPRYYGTVHLGQNNLRTWDANVDFGPTTVAGELRLDRTLHLGVIAGRQKDRTRLELEYQRGSVKINQATLGPVTQAGNGSGHYQTVTVGAYRTFELATDINAFGGVALGWGSVSLPGLGAVNSCTCFNAARGSGLVVQARLGAEYEIATDKHMLLQYTWLVLPRASASTAVPSVHYERKILGAWGVGYRAVF